MTRHRIFYARLAMTAAAVLAALCVETISEPVLPYLEYGFGLLLLALSQYPFRGGGIILLVGTVVFLFFVGARMASHTSIYFVSRAVLLLVSVVAWVLSQWSFTISVYMYVAIAEHGAEKNTLVVISVALILLILFLALAAAAIKYSVGWPVSYWTTFLATIASFPAMLIAFAGLSRMLWG